MPRNDVRFRVNDLFVGEEGVGQVTGTLALRGSELSGEIDAASPRLALTGTGRIALDAAGRRRADVPLPRQSLDPYVRLFVPKLSPFTTAVASGSIRVVGELADVDHLLVDAHGRHARHAAVRLRAQERGADPARARSAAWSSVDDLQLVGEDTQLRRRRARSACTTSGLRCRRSATRTSASCRDSSATSAARAAPTLTAAVDGPLREPVFSGSATITDGRVRHFSLPNALDAINGTIRFDSRGIRLDDLTATMGGGRVQFGGRIGFDGYLPGELNVTVRGEDMHLRYPEGVRSVVDADLSLRGNVKAPTLGGIVTVKSAVWTPADRRAGSIFDFGVAARPRAGGAGAGDAAPAVPLRFDIADPGAVDAAGREQPRARWSRAPT